MSTRQNLVAGMALGGGLMYLLDPQAGGRRRALTRDKATKWSRLTGRTLRGGWQRSLGASRGMAAAVSRLKQGERTDDEALAQRLRQCIARHSTHPRAIDVSVSNGIARFSGPVLAVEADEVLRCASAVNGVLAVENDLKVHQDPANVPALQGEPHRRPLTRWWEVSPALRIGTGIAAVAVAALAATVAGRRRWHDDPAFGYQP